MDKPMTTSNQMSGSLNEIMQRQQGEYRYLLLDPLKAVAEINPLSLPTLRNELGERAIFPVLRSDLAYSPPHCPQLVLLASPDEPGDVAWLAGAERYARSEALHEKRYLCAWLSSTLPPASLAVALAARCQQPVEGGFIPLFEPLRFELLQAMLPAEQMSGAVWPVSQWLYMRTSGEIACQPGSASADNRPVNWAVESAQREVREIWALLFAWQRVSSLLPENAVLQALQAWQGTACTGLNRRDDRHFLALNRLTLPEEIEKHPAVMCVLQQAIAEPHQSFIHLFSTLPDSVWQELEKTIMP
ncbi:hypothetical protein EC836_104131 [Erwinia sp. JUb26]|nr:hypothetical protein EC836_104131 [Erwinia sp. JUb26]